MTNYDQWCKTNNINQTTKELFKEWMSERAGGYHSDITGMSTPMYDSLFPMYLSIFRRDLLENDREQYEDC